MAPSGDARVASHPRLIDRVPLGALASPDAILDRFLRWVTDQGLEPYPAQEEALLELMTGHHVVLSTPTGSGKSLVALGLHFKALCEGERSFYTAPIKALASEKFFELCGHFGPENVGMLTGDASINPGAPVICCTAEVLANMAVQPGAADRRALRGDGRVPLLRRRPARGGLADSADRPAQEPLPAALGHPRQHGAHRGAPRRAAAGARSPRSTAASGPCPWTSSTRRPRCTRPSSACSRAGAPPSTWCTSPSARPPSRPRRSPAPG